MIILHEASSRTCHVKTYFLVLNFLVLNASWLLIIGPIIGKVGAAECVRLPDGEKGAESGKLQKRDKGAEVEPPFKESHG